MSSESSLSRPFSLSCVCSPHVQPSAPPAARWGFASQMKEGRICGPLRRKRRYSCHQHLRFGSWGPGVCFVWVKTVKSGVEGQCWLAAGLNLVQKLGSFPPPHPPTLSIFKRNKRSGSSSSGTPGGAAPGVQRQHTSTASLCCIAALRAVLEAAGVTGLHGQPGDTGDTWYPQAYPHWGSG